jgi:hypothetical protein
MSRRNIFCICAATSFFISYPLLMVAADLTSVVGSGSAGAGSAAPRGDLRYRVSALQPGPAATEAELYQLADMNDKGQVLVTRWFEGRQRAYLWQKGRLVELTDLVNPNSIQIIPRGMNDHAAIVGQDQIDGFLLFRARVTQVDPKSGTAVTPIDINNRGQILGRTDFLQTPGEESFLMRGSKVEVLQPFPGDFGTWPLALNDHGIVVGQSTGIGVVRATIWDRDTVMEIPVPADALGAAAYAINNHNQVLVSVWHQAGGTDSFIWENGELVALQSFSPQLSVAGGASINDCGTVVGTVNPPIFSPTGSRATLWRKEVPVDLNSLISDTDPLQPFVTLIYGLRINNRDEIVAVGLDSRVPQQQFNFWQEFLYVLTPIEQHRGTANVGACNRKRTGLSE